MFVIVSLPFKGLIPKFLICLVTFDLNWPIIESTESGSKVLFVRPTRWVALTITI